jgi:hypothetical protein
MTKKRTKQRFFLPIVDPATGFLTGVVMIRSKGISVIALRPPTNAEFLFYIFLSPENCDALVGDLQERYRIIRKKFGARRANFWYWVQVITSVGPIAWAATKKLVKAVSGVAALAEVWRRTRG